jgi:hypothetical protein
MPAWLPGYRICLYHCNVGSMMLNGGAVRWCQQVGPPARKLPRPAPPCPAAALALCSAPPCLLWQAHEWLPAGLLQCGRFQALVEFEGNR